MIPGTRYQVLGPPDDNFFEDVPTRVICPILGWGEFLIQVLFQMKESISLGTNLDR